MIIGPAPAALWGGEPQAPAAGRRAHRRRDGQGPEGGGARERRPGVGVHPPRGPGARRRRVAGDRRPRRQRPAPYGSGARRGARGGRGAAR